MGNAIFAAVQAFLRQRFEIRFRHELGGSTYMTPVGVTVNENRRIYHGLITRIGNSLGQALRKAQSKLEVGPADTLLPPGGRNVF
jgi:hypothetical protein